eukprot:scaffold24398_cov133-Isochrysis_galbana.AAC.9
MKTVEGRGSHCSRRPPPSQGAASRLIVANVGDAKEAIAADATGQQRSLGASTPRRAATERAACATGVCPPSRGIGQVKRNQ